MVFVYVCLKEKRAHATRVTGSFYCFIMFCTFYTLHHFTQFAASDSLMLTLGLQQAGEDTFDLIVAADVSYDPDT